MEYIGDKLISPHRLSEDAAIAWSLSAYAQDEWNITDRFNVTADLRLGHHKEFGKTLTPKISALYKLGSFNLRTAYSNGFKAPTVKELYYHYYATIMSKMKAYYGNTDLKAQQSDYYAMNVEYRLPRFKATITGFHNNIRSMISLQTVPTSYEDKVLLTEETMKYVNLAKGRTYGLDFTFDADLPMNVKTGGGYSYLDAKAQRTDDESADDYMKYVYMKEYKDVIISLSPLMSITGDHAQNDLLGDLEEGQTKDKVNPYESDHESEYSWKLKLEKLGFTISTAGTITDPDKFNVIGLADHKDIRTIWLNHMKEAVENAESWNDHLGIES
jgi:outer membrane receptor for ferrienterochelin and colicin